MSIAASDIELDHPEESMNPTNEVSNPHLAQSLDVLASASPPGASGPVIAVDLDDASFLNTLYYNIYNLTILWLRRS